MNWRQIILMALLWPVGAGALEVRETRWGFDGVVVPDRFNLLSVLVDNPSAEPFDGFVELAQPAGAPDRQPCYLAPGTARWVQFFPLVRHQNMYGWKIRWGPGRAGEVDLAVPATGAPKRVLLTAPDDPAPRVKLRTFPDELVPVTLPMLDGLAGVVVDSVPKWPAARRAALLDWLQAGGTMHVLLGPTGQPVEFPESWGELHSATDRQAIGRGRVYRHPVTRTQITERMLTDAAGELPRKEAGTTVRFYDFDQRLFQAVRPPAQTEFHWAMIYVLTVAYLGLIGPGLFFFGRRKRDYRVSLAVLVGTVGCFGLVFGVVGQRGAGEKPVTHSLTYARSVGPGRFDATQWKNVFVTRGANYTLRHATTHGLYATGREFETVNGAIMSGKDGAFAVDIPPFSNRSFQHRAWFRAEKCDLAWDGGDRLEQLRVFVPTNAVNVWAWDGQRLYEFVKEQDFWRLDPGKSTGWLPEQIGTSTVLGPAHGGAEPMNRQAVPLICYALGGLGLFPENITTQRPAGAIDLFYFAPSPASFAVAGTDGAETGYTLFHFPPL